MAEHSQDSTNDLIASDRVEGTTVYNSEHEKLGRIENIMIDKVSGQAEFAVMSFGGFLGIGEDHYPVPWNKLRYDTDVSGYVIDLDKATLEGAPRYSAEEEPLFDRAYGGTVGGYYGV